MALMNLSEVPQVCFPSLAQNPLAISPGVQVPGMEVEIPQDSCGACHCAVGSTDDPIEGVVEVVLWIGLSILLVKTKAKCVMNQLLLKNVHK